MPTYKYNCKECENTFSIKASIAEKSAGLEPACPECGSKDVYQSFGSIGIIGSSQSGPGGCAPNTGCC